MLSSAKVKFAMANPHVHFEDTVAAETNYVARESQSQTEKVQ